ncbi:MAG: extracellular solute-binding protein [Hyphomicrobiaceae bacterium]|nr:extracellular solute-binding protein [Hyphomicrobiaceae bacterium]
MSRSRGGLIFPGVSSGDRPPATNREYRVQARLKRSIGKGLLALAIAALALHAGPGDLEAGAATRHHALSLVGEPRFGPDFEHFDWVNPDAPKGGTVRQWALGSFDSLNAFSVRGNPATGLALIYDTLMTTSPDEPSTEYGLIAEWVSYPDDFSTVTFRLRPEARFHDGAPIRPEDVVFSLEALKKAHPHYNAYYRNVVRAEKTGEHEVTFTFDQKGNRELPQIVGQLPVLPKHFWEAKGAGGEQRDLSRSSLEVPLGSGPYRIKSFDAGRSIVYERVNDWWAKDLPVSKGQWNFDELSFTYFRDRVPAFEAFKVGNIDFWRETSAKNWATSYDFEALRRGHVKKEEIAVKTVTPMQAFVMNTRRNQLQDPRVRRAFNLAFDFEWMNRNLFFDQYKRTESYFGNSELQATGLPTGRELEILKEIEKEVPPEVFTTEWKNPVNVTPEDQRNNLRQAARLLAEAGWKPSGGVLTNAAGEQLTVEFLLVQPDFERVVLPFKTNLERLGVRASVRIVDTSQYQRRSDTFDYDIIVDSFPQSISPGNEQRNFWGSAAAGTEGSQNSIGVRNPAVDKLIDKIIFAGDRAELVAATRALDRVLLWNHYVIPQWHTPFDRIATWDMFGRPEKLPEQAVSFMRVWWMDPDAQKKLAMERGR